MDEPARLVINVTLNTDGVLAPVQRAVRQTVDVVTFSLNAIEQGDLSGWPQTDLMRFNLSFSDEISAEERKTAYTHWLLAKGFQDLARGTKLMLEEAYLYNGMVARAGGLRTLVEPLVELQAAEQELRAAATNKKFPQLLDEVQKRLTSPLHYERELLSLQVVRNCLEHREGIVQERDVDPATHVLHLRWPRVRLFYQDQGRQIELGRGSQVEKDTAIMQDIVVERREFKLGERVTFKADEFHDIGFGCLAIHPQETSPMLPADLIAEIATNLSALDLQPNSAAQILAAVLAPLMRAGGTIVRPPVGAPEPPRRRGGRPRARPKARRAPRRKYTRGPDDARQRAARALAANPGLSLTAVAKIAKVSRSTVVNASKDLAKSKPTTDAKPNRYQRAQRFLREQLGDGPKLVQDIEAAAAKARVDIVALESASGALGVVTSRANTGGAQAVQWSLPG